MPGRLWHRPIIGYVLSIPAVGITSLAVLWVQHLFPYLSFFDSLLLLAVMVIAMIWGIGPALFSALLSTAVLASMYIPLSVSLDMTTLNSLRPVAPFFLSSVIIAVVIGQIESARRRAHSAEQDEQERANELEGPGLTPEEQQAIWERFYQLKRMSVLSGSGIGLGLGLHICQTIIEQHQGRVGVQSSPGEGSTFWFTLPLARNQAQH